MGLPICAIDGPERKRRRLDGDTGLEVSDTEDVAFKDDVASSSQAPVPSAPRLALWAADLSSDSETSEEDDVRPFAASLQSYMRPLPPITDTSGDNPMIPASVLQPWRMWDNDDEDEQQQLPRPRRRTLLTLPLRRRNAFRVSSTSSSRELDSEIDNNRSTTAELLRRINVSSNRSPPPPQISETHLMSELSEFVAGGTLSAEVADMYRQGMVSAQEAAYLSRSGSEEQHASDHVSETGHLTHVSDSRATTPLRSSTPLDAEDPGNLSSSSSRLARLEADFERLETERRMRDFDAPDSHYGPVSSNRPAPSFMGHPPDAHLGDLTSPRATITEQTAPPVVADTVPLLSQQLADTAARQTVHFEFPAATHSAAEERGVTEFHSGASIDSDSNRSLPSDSPSGHVSFGSVSFAADTADSQSSSEPGESPESPQVLPIEDTLVIPFMRSPSPYEYPVSPASSIDFERRDYNRRRSRSLECLEEGGRRGRSRGGRSAGDRAAYASDPEPDVAVFPHSGDVSHRRSNSLPFSSRRQSVGSQSEPESSMRRSRSQSTGSDRRVRFRLAVRFQ
ncbi:hypothetical protein CJU89_3198 [Yarrowia sp. B02]|nr:hypothetical protein CJU89_3198 [Yarrowia sp. B02]